MGLGNSFGISSETNNNIVTDGLILDINASYKKSYPKSGTALTDLSGNHANGTLTNGPTFSDSFGGAINLDGTNDFFFVPRNNNNKINDELIAIKRLAFVKERFIPPILISGPIL